MNNNNNNDADKMTKSQWRHEKREHKKMELKQCDLNAQLTTTYATF